MKVAIIGDHPWGLRLAQKINEIEGYAKIFDDPNQIYSIQKRFRSQFDGEKNRFKDLFRVIYKITPKVSEKDLSLDKTLADVFESFEDFDIIIDAQFSTRKPNLLRVCPEYVIGENQCLSFLEMVQKESSLASENIIVNLASLSLELLLKDKEAIFQKKKIVLLIHENQKIEEHLSEEEKLQWQNFIQDLTHFHQQELQDYAQKLTEWEELENFEKAKIKKPIIPVSGLSIYFESKILAISKLSDQKNIFITLESPQNDFIPQIISAEKVLIDNGFYACNKIYRSLYPPEFLLEDFFEKGFFTVVPNLWMGKKFEPKQDNVTDKIMEKILSYFTRV